LTGERHYQGERLIDKNHGRREEGGEELFDVHVGNVTFDVISVVYTE
jgi:hypothetical protein